MCLRGNTSLWCVFVVFVGFSIDFLPSLELMKMNKKYIAQYIAHHSRIQLAIEVAHQVQRKVRRKSKRDLSRNPLSLLNLSSASPFASSVARNRSENDAVSNGNVFIWRTCLLLAPCAFEDAASKLALESAASVCANHCF